MKKKRLMLVYLLTVLSIIFLTKILGVGLPVLCVDLIVSVFVLLMSREEVLYSMIFLLPLSPCFETSAHIWVIYVLALLVKKMKISLAFIIYSSIFLILELIAHFYYGVSDLNRMISYLFSMLIFIYLIVEVKRANVSLNKALKIYCVSILVFLIFYILSIFVGEGVDGFTALFAGGARLGGTASDEFGNLSIRINANSLAYYCISEIAIMMVMMREKILDRRTKRILLFGTFFIIIFGLLTGSRTFVISFGACMMLFWLSSLKSKKQIIVSSLLLLVVCSTFIVLVNSNLPAIDFLVSRFGRNDMASMNGRTEILSQYMNGFFSKNTFMAFGSGVTDYTTIFGFDYAIHNGIAQVLVCCGIFGFLTFLLLVLKPVFIALANKKPFYKFIPLIVCLIFLQTIQLLNPCILLFPLAVSYIPLLDNNKKGELSELCKKNK